MSLLKSIRLIGYIELRSLAITSAVLIAAAILPTASAQTNADVTRDSCVSTSMIRQLAREQNAVRVSPSSEAVARNVGSDENEKGIAFAQSPETTGTLQEAHRWFEKGARKGYAPAQVNLAVLSIAGWGTTPNAGTALYWLREAAQQGYALAHFDLGILYLNGCGVQKDYREAFSQFEQGANAGDSAAQMNLGYLYDRGLGVTQDLAQAAVWYRKAAESGVAQAQYDLADLYVRGEGVPRDESTAFAWFQKAAQQGHTAARILLGNMYAEGRGTEKDLQSAYAWLLAASLQGDRRGSATLQALERRFSPEQLAESRMRARALAQPAKPRRDAEVALLH